MSFSASLSSALCNSSKKSLHSHFSRLLSFCPSLERLKSLKKSSKTLQLHERESLLALLGLLKRNSDVWASSVDYVVSVLAYIPYVVPPTHGRVFAERLSTCALETGIGELITAVTDAFESLSSSQTVQECLARLFRIRIPSAEGQFAADTSFSGSGRVGASVLLGFCNSLANSPLDWPQEMVNRLMAHVDPLLMKFRCSGNSPTGALSVSAFRATLLSILGQLVPRPSAMEESVPPHVQTLFELAKSELAVVVPVEISQRAAALLMACGCYSAPLQQKTAGLLLRTLRGTMTQLTSGRARTDGPKAEEYAMSLLKMIADLCSGSASLIGSVIDNLSKSLMDQRLYGSVFRISTPDKNGVRTCSPLLTSVMETVAVLCSLELEQQCVPYIESGSRRVIIACSNFLYKIRSLVSSSSDVSSPISPRSRHASVVMNHDHPVPRDVRSTRSRSMGCSSADSVKCTIGIAVVTMLGKIGQAFSVPEATTSVAQLLMDTLSTASKSLESSAEAEPERLQDTTGQSQGLSFLVGPVAESLSLMSVGAGDFGMMATVVEHLFTVGRSPFQRGAMEIADRLFESLQLHAPAMSKTSLHAFLNRVLVLACQYGFEAQKLVDVQGERMIPKIVNSIGRVLPVIALLLEQLDYVQCDTGGGGGVCPGCGSSVCPSLVSLREGCPDGNRDTVRQFRNLWFYLVLYGFTEVTAPGEAPTAQSKWPTELVETVKVIAKYTPVLVTASQSIEMELEYSLPLRATSVQTTLTSLRSAMQRLFPSHGAQLNGLAPTPFVFVASVYYLEALRVVGGLALPCSLAYLMNEGVRRAGQLQSVLMAVSVKCFAICRKALLHCPPSLFREQTVRFHCLVLLQNCSHRFDYVRNASMEGLVLLLDGFPWLAFDSQVLIECCQQVSKLSDLVMARFQYPVQGREAIGDLHAPSARSEQIAVAQSLSKLLQTWVGKCFLYVPRLAVSILQECHRQVAGSERSVFFPSKSAGCKGVAVLLEAVAAQPPHGLLDGSSGESASLLFTPGISPLRALLSSVAFTSACLGRVVTLVYVGDGIGSKLLRDCRLLSSGVGVAGNPRAVCGSCGGKEHSSHCSESPFDAMTACLVADELVSQYVACLRATIEEKESMPAFMCGKRRSADRSLLNLPNLFASRTAIRQPVLRPAADPIPDTKRPRIPRYPEKGSGPGRRGGKKGSKRSTKSRAKGAMKKVRRRPERCVTAAQFKRWKKRWTRKFGEMRAMLANTEEREGEENPTMVQSDGPADERADSGLEESDFERSAVPQSASGKNRAEVNQVLVGDAVQDLLLHAAAWLVLLEPPNHICDTASLLHLARRQLVHLLAWAPTRFCRPAVAETARSCWQWVYASAAGVRDILIHETTFAWRHLVDAGIGLFSGQYVSAKVTDPDLLFNAPLSPTASTSRGRLVPRPATLLAEKERIEACHIWFGFYEELLKGKLVRLSPIASKSLLHLVFKSYGSNNGVRLGLNGNGGWGKRELGFSRLPSAFGLRIRFALFSLKLAKRCSVLGLTLSSATLRCGSPESGSSRPLLPPSPSSPSSSSPARSVTVIASPTTPFARVRFAEQASRSHRASPPLRSSTNSRSVPDFRSRLNRSRSVSPPPPPPSYSAGNVQKNRKKDGEKPSSILQQAIATSVFMESVDWFSGKPVWYQVEVGADRVAREFPEIVRFCRRIQNGCFDALDVCSVQPIATPGFTSAQPRRHERWTTRGEKQGSLDLQTVLLSSSMGLSMKLCPLYRQKQSSQRLQDSFRRYGWYSQLPSGAGETVNPISLDSVHLKNLLMLFFAHEIDRIVTWYNPTSKPACGLPGEREFLLSSWQPVASKQWIETVQSAWLVNPVLVMRLLDRFSGVEVIRLEAARLIWSLKRYSHPSARHATCFNCPGLSPQLLAPSGNLRHPLLDDDSIPDVLCVSILQTRPSTQHSLECLLGTAAPTGRIPGNSTFPPDLPYQASKSAVFPDCPLSHDAWRVLLTQAPCSLPALLQFFLRVQPKGLYSVPLCVNSPWVRGYAWRVMKSFPVSTIVFYLPQLVQSLRYDNQMEGLLSAFFLEASMFSRQVAHELVWILRTESKFDSVASTASYGFQQQLQGSDPLPDICGALLEKVVSSFGVGDSTLYHYQFDLFEHMTGISGELMTVEPAARKNYIIERSTAIGKNMKLKVFPKGAGKKGAADLDATDPSWEMPSHLEDLSVALAERSVSRVLKIAYLPTDPRHLVLGVIPTSATSLQSAAKCPFLLSFIVRPFSSSELTVVLGKGDSIEGKRSTRQIKAGLGKWGGKMRAKWHSATDRMKIRYHASKEARRRRKLQPQSQSSGGRNGGRFRRFRKKNKRKAGEAEVALESSAVEVEMTELEKIGDLTAAQDSSLEESSEDGGVPETKLSEPPPGPVQPPPVLPPPVEVPKADLDEVEAPHGELDAPRQPSASTPDQPVPSALETRSLIFKVNDDCRQDALAMQAIQLLQCVFNKSHLGLYTYPYRVIPSRTGKDRAIGGIIECVPNVRSRDQIGKMGFQTLHAFFESTFGPLDGPDYGKARTAMRHSLAAYAVVCYLLQIKDRHNGNLLVDGDGHLVHIDFGFLLGRSPGGDLGFESAAFKLTQEMVDVLGGLESPAFHDFLEETIRAFMLAREVGSPLRTIVSALSDSGLPCFLFSDTLTKLQNRFYDNCSPGKAARNMYQLVLDAVGKWTTVLYDGIQLLQNDIQ